MSRYAIQRDEDQRQQFIDDVSIYNPEMIIFLKTDRRDALRRKGYSMRGKPVRNQQLLIRGEHVSVISFLSIEGILGCSIV